MNIDVVSFDADGTLISRDLVDRFWFYEVPRLYSRQHDVDVKQAKQFIQTRYDEVGPENLSWYLPEYWFDQFQLESDPEEVASNIAHEATVFEDAWKILHQLHHRYSLVVTSNGARQFLNVALTPLEGYFHSVYSSVSDFRKIKTDSQVYRTVADKHDAVPNRLLHVGDDWEADYEAPRRVGAKSVFLSRDSSSGPGGDHVISRLTELVDILEQ